MPETPQPELEEAYGEGLECAICGAEALQVSHLANLPDYVTCAECGSAFVVEDTGERIMYGQIAEAYPATSKYALGQWAWPEAIARKAVEERPGETEPEEDPSLAGTAPLFEPTLALPDEFSELQDAEKEIETGGPDAQEDVETPDSSVLSRFSVQAPPDDGADEAAAFEPPFELPPAELMEELPSEPPFTEDEEPDLDELFSDEESILDPHPEEPISAQLQSLGSAVDGRPGVEAENGVEDGAATEEAAAEESPIEAEEAEAEIEPPADEPEPIDLDDVLPTEVEPPDSREPLRGERFQVVVKGTNVRFPRDMCAHCTRTPVRGQLAVAGSLPRGDGSPDRKPAAFNVPLCRECRNRAAARSEDERSARLQAHLFSGLIALVLIVGAVGLGLVNFPSSAITDGFILLILAVLGYALPVMLLLGRAGRMPPPPDALFVRTTLVSPGNREDERTPFEWRNRTYAEAFIEANAGNIFGEIMPMRDRVPSPEAPPEVEVEVEE